MDVRTLSCTQYILSYQFAYIPDDINNVFSNGMDSFNNTLEKITMVTMNLNKTMNTSIGTLDKLNGQISKDLH